MTSGVFSMEQIVGSISSFESLDLNSRIDTRTRWIWCRFPITNRIDHSRTMKDFVSWPGRVASKKVDHVSSLCRDKHRGLTYIPEDMKFIRPDSTSKCIPPSLSEQTPFYIRRHQPSNVSLKEEKMKHSYSQCALDRSNRTSREDYEENTHTHTHMYHRSIDRHTGLSEKPSLLRNRIVLSRLTWISFFIAVRRIR